MENILLPLPVEFESANSKFDNRSFYRILISLGAFFLSIAIFAFFLKMLIHSTNETEYGHLFQFIFIVLLIPVIMFSFIWGSSFVVIKCLPPDKMYKISNDFIEIRNEKLNEIKIYPNQNILSLDSIEDEFMVHALNENFKLPKIVNPIGSGIKLVVLPFSMNVGFTALRMHRIVLINGKIQIERFWGHDIKSSK